MENISARPERLALQLPRPGPGFQARLKLLGGKYLLAPPTEYLKRYDLRDGTLVEDGEEVVFAIPVGADAGREVIGAAFVCVIAGFVLGRRLRLEVVGTQFFHHKSCAHHAASGAGDGDAVYPGQEVVNIAIFTASGGPGVGVRLRAPIDQSGGYNTLVAGARVKYGHFEVEGFDP